MSNSLLVSQQPLPEILRPGEISDFLGQEHLRARLSALLKAQRLPSILLFGPPGCGKSTLALLLAKSSGKNFIRLSAPETGIPQLRRSIANADILILDELHRFSKAQQDFFLPLLESGQLTLIATTTENPSFSVTPQLLSRMHLFRLQPLDGPTLNELAKKGAEKLDFKLEEDVAEHLAKLSGGDARSLLNMVEYLAKLPEEDRTGDKVKKLLPEILTRHDRGGDSHYELASALIKSIRGSDVDAALYYLAALLEGGEDPRFVCRRLILSASEDVGLADPQALPLAVACQQAVEFVGMPEGFIPLAETVVYLALARKSNSAYAGYLKALAEIKRNGKKPVPLHLRNASTSLQKSWGYGKNYKYPHDNSESWLEQDYLPDELAGQRFFRPRDNGAEPSLTAWWRSLPPNRNTAES